MLGSAILFLFNIATFGALKLPNGQTSTIQNLKSKIQNGISGQLSEEWKWWVINHSLKNGYKTQRLLSSSPPLESGDRLSRDEFERRYDAMPQIKKAELIEGVIYVASPVRSRSHGQPHAAIIGWLFTYFVATPGVDLNDNAMVRLDQGNEPQPDALLRIEAAAGGQSRLRNDDYVEGAPELVVEVAASSAALDLHDKKRAYRRNAVQEYIVWRVLDRQVDWFRLRGSDYISLQADADGVIRSQIFPGLWLNVEALLAGDITQVLTGLQAGLQSSEHQEFVQQLIA